MFHPSRSLAAIRNDKGLLLFVLFGGMFLTLLCNGKTFSFSHKTTPLVLRVSPVSTPAVKSTSQTTSQTKLLSLAISKPITTTKTLPLSQKSLVSTTALKTDIPNLLHAPTPSSNLPAVVPTTPIWASPQYQHAPFPAYPPEAIEEHREGTVQLLVTINEMGAPTHVTVWESSGFFALDHAATTAVANWSFFPATKDGKTAVSKSLIPIQFKLSS